jgi:serine/threonine protein kinase/tetratricopeptide (TPR) repeat protein
MDEHLNLHAPTGLKPPHRNGNGSPEQPLGHADDPRFADRLRITASLSPSILRYPGPRDYCGFEAPPQSQFDEPPLVDPAGPSQRATAGSRLTGGRDLREPSWPCPGSPDGGPNRTREERSPDHWTAASAGTFGQSGEHEPGAAPRLKQPGVPGYEILGELGRGGMGVVYKARQLRLNRVVALKMILAGEYAGTDAVARFLAEAEMVAQLRHPNIVQIHAIGDCDGRPYVELEYVEGGSLSLRLDGKPWPPRAAARLIESLASAVALAHRLGIVHRDLKPANILMTDDGTPKITDFGLAKSSEKSLGLTKTNSILGSPSYMAPEQAEGQAKDVGPVADIYALGANLYELLTGRPPFVGPTVLATLDLVKNTEPVPPRCMQPGVPADLETICLKCLRKEQSRRYESADALAEDLGRFLAGEPILARPTPRWERALKWVRRRPSTAALIAVSALSIVATAAGGFWYRAEQDRHRAAIRRRIEGVRQQASRFILLGAEAIRRKDWDAASAQMSSALALFRTEPELLGHSADAKRMLDLCRAKIAAREARTAARTRLAAFRHFYDEAVFYQSEYTGLDAATNLRASRTAARQALDQFQPDAGSGRGLALPAGAFDASEAEEITERYYELALGLAAAIARPLPGEDPVAQATESLQILDQIERVRPPTRAFFVRRGDYLLRIGDKEAAQAMHTRAAAAARAGESTVDAFLEAKAAYGRHDYAQAIAALRRLLSGQPAHFWGHYLLAICELKQHDPRAAQAALTVCQAARPDFVWTYLLKGFAESEMGEFDLAETDFKHAADRGLDAASRYVMLVNRGVMRLRRGWAELAAGDFSAAIELEPDRFQAYVNLAQAHQNLGRFDQALAVLDRAITRSTKEAVLYRARARVHRLRLHDSEALADLDRAIALAPAHDPARRGDHLERALIFDKEGRHDQALAECDRVVAENHDAPDVHRIRGAILVKLRRFDEAIRAFDLCIAKGNASPALYETRALALAQRGSFERAIADYTLALSAGRQSASLYTNRGWAYLLSGAPGPAIRDFDQALRLDPGDAHARSGRAMANVQQRKVPEAIADAHASVLRSGPDARLVYTAARVYCQAAACLEADPACSHRVWELAGRYRALALTLINRAIELLPAPKRAAFWSQVIRTDTALGPIRTSQKFLHLDAQFGHAGERGASSEAISER